MEPQTMPEDPTKSELTPRGLEDPAGGPPPVRPPSGPVLAAYRVCEGIARREARNFYYAFRALPRAKRNAISAVYAFMRHADDLSDDESKSHAERRVALDEWLAAWHTADSQFDGASVPPARDDASRAAVSVMESVFLALADARRRFGISSELLDELVQGTAMDLDRALSTVPLGPVAAGTETGNASNVDLYETFDELYRYCYLVASVVGLVCIRIFGYEDRRAEKLAEETGVAFQLTNILRDVREDAERGRIYLPVEDMARYGVRTSEFSGAEVGRPTPAQRELLAFEAARAEVYYKSAQALLPLIAADSRPALWVLVTIYHRLLERIVESGYEVFGEKVRVSTPEKLWILAHGLMQVCGTRLGRR